MTSPWQVVAGRWPASWPLQPLSRQQWSSQRPTYAQARPEIIDAALQRAKVRPSGNWFVLAASREVRADRPYGVHIGGVELVAWRGDAGELIVGPGACPHLGGPLAQGRIDCGTLRCRWHGLALDGRPRWGWTALPSHDDGVLAWVRLDEQGGEEPTRYPVVPQRPESASAVDAVATVTGVCEPDDVVANRLDPWHGAWFHPYSFARLRVLESPPTGEVETADDRFLVEVTFRAATGFGVPVLAEFTCPDPRTVVMRIAEGEGAGSVVETHATPRYTGSDGRCRTAVIEATIASSPRRGFAVARRAAPLLRPMIRQTARRLWRDDLAYAERRYHLRTDRGWKFGES